MTKLFLSHISEETPLAKTLKESLEHALKDVELFVSSVNIKLGEPWLVALDQALTDAIAILVLCSPRSMARPWVNFECGAGWGRKVKVIPICHGGMTKQALPDPLGMLQGMTFHRGSAGSRAVIQELSDALGLTLRDDADLEALAERLDTAAWRTRDLGEAVGIVLTARQREWRQGSGGSVFDLLDGTLPGRLGIDRKFTFVDDCEQLRLDRIADFRGLVVGNPWRSSLSDDEMDAIEQFVRDGGRLLLLGYELGDRHHGGNLGELSRRFGIYPTTDIVGPADHTDKPYDAAVDFEVEAGGAHPHHLTKDLGSIRLTNVQTLRVEPGGVEWLQVGSNAVFRPLPDRARYAHDGTLTSGKSDFERNDRAGWLAVGVEAPEGLCGKGGVIAIGTWDMLGRNGDFLDNPGNLKLVRRLFDWLAGDGETDR